MRPECANFHSFLISLELCRKLIKLSSFALQVLYARVGLVEIAGIAVLKSSNAYWYLLLYTYLLTSKVLNTVENDD